MTADRWARVQAIFESALPRETIERRQIIDRACGDDADLRADVASLLAADSETGMFLVGPALDEALAVMAPKARFAPGDKVGPFELTATLGAGGMGDVFLDGVVSPSATAALYAVSRTTILRNLFQIPLP
jgi:hypothetical protein